MIIPSQVAVGTAPTILVTMPAGPATVTITVAGGTAATIYLGAGPSVTTSTGAPVIGGAPLTLAGYPASGPTTLYAVAPADVAVGVILTTDR